jgi:hypothetical protein
MIFNIFLLFICLRHCKVHRNHIRSFLPCLGHAAVPDNFISLNVTDSYACFRLSASRLTKYNFRNMNW